MNSINTIHNQSHNQSQQATHSIKPNNNSTNTPPDQSKNPLPPSGAKGGKIKKFLQGGINHLNDPDKHSAHSDNLSDKLDAFAKKSLFVESKIEKHPKVEAALDTSNSGIPGKIIKKIIKEELAVIDMAGHAAYAASHAVLAYAGVPGRALAIAIAAITKIAAVAFVLIANIAGLAPAAVFGLLSLPSIVTTAVYHEMSVKPAFDTIKKEQSAQKKKNEALEKENKELKETVENLTAANAANAAKDAAKSENKGWFSWFHRSPTKTTANPVKTTANPVPSNKTTEKKENKTNSVPDNKKTEKKENKTNSVPDNKKTEKKENKTNSVPDNKTNEKKENKTNSVPDNKTNEKKENKTNSVPSNKTNEKKENKTNLIQSNVKINKVDNKKSNSTNIVTKEELEKARKDAEEARKNSGAYKMDDKNSSNNNVSNALFN